MEVWYDPNTNQVMAVYSGSYTGSHWSSQGFIRAKSRFRLDRRYRVTVRNGEVTSAEEVFSPPAQSRAPTEQELLFAAVLADLNARYRNDPSAPKAVRDYLTAKG